MTAVVLCPCGCTAADRPDYPEGYNPGGWARIEAWAHHHYVTINERDDRCGAFLDHCRTLLTYQHEENLPFAGPVWRWCRSPSPRPTESSRRGGLVTTWRARAELPTGHLLKVRVHWRILVNDDHTVVVKCGIGVEGGGSIFLSRSVDTLLSKADDWLSQTKAIHEMLSTAHHTRLFIVEHAAPQRGLRPV